VDAICEIIENNPIRVDDFAGLDIPGGENEVNGPWNTQS
jgi:hypothetical protein